MDAMRTIMAGRDLDSLPHIIQFRTDRCSEVEVRVYRHDGAGNEAAPWLQVSNVALHSDSPGRHVHFSLTFTGGAAESVNPLVSRERGHSTGPVTAAERDTVVRQVREALLAFLAADPLPVQSWFEDGEWHSPSPTEEAQQYVRAAYPTDAGWLLKAASFSDQGTNGSTLAELTARNKILADLADRGFMNRSVRGIYHWEGGLPARLRYVSRSRDTPTPLARQGRATWQRSAAVAAAADRSLAAVASRPPRSRTPGNLPAEVTEMSRARHATVDRRRPARRRPRYAPQEPGGPRGPRQRRRGHGRLPRGLLSHRRAGSHPAARRHRRPGLAVPRPTGRTGLHVIDAEAKKLHTAAMGRRLVKGLSATDRLALMASSRAGAPAAGCRAGPGLAGGPGGACGDAGSEPPGPPRRALARAERPPAGRFGIAAGKVPELPWHGPVFSCQCQPAAVRVDGVEGDVQVMSSGDEIPDTGH